MLGLRVKGLGLLSRFLVVAYASAPTHLGFEVQDLGLRVWGSTRILAVHAWLEFRI